MNISVVHINGITQIPVIDYTVVSNSISFNVPPSLGSRISVHYPISDTGRGSICELFEGNGSTYLWHLGEDNKEDKYIQDLLKDAWDMRTVPAVADVLERLQVVVSLAKENG